FGTRVSGGKFHYPSASILHPSSFRLQLSDFRLHPLNFNIYHLHLPISEPANGPTESRLGLRLTPSWLPPAHPPRFVPRFPDPGARPPTLWHHPLVRP